MDFAQVLLVRVFHVLHIVLLHLLWHDDCGSYTKSPCRFSCGFCILWNLEPLFRVCHCTTSKYFQPLNALYLRMDSIQWMSLWWSSLFYFRLCCLFKTEHSCVVEVVLLGMSSGLDHIRVGCLAVWGYNQCDEIRKYVSARVHKKSFGYQTWFRRSFSNYGFWVCSAICYYFCCLNQGLQLPKAID